MDLIFKLYVYLVSSLRPLGSHLSQILIGGKAELLQNRFVLAYW